MDGFAVDVNVDERAGGRRENGDSREGSHVYGKHRRSNSANDRNLNTPRCGVLRALQNDFNGTHENAHSERNSGARSPLHECSINPSNYITSNHRVSLEKDIEELQLRLQQEKSMRILLERAMGRASSTLSPGHRHFAAQTKELIAEIELLEEEVANREQHVLSLYRSIFEHCVSQPTSKQSSGLSSPAHLKNESRKHPSIISSAFCSSKKFPLRSFQALASINDLRKRTLPSQSKRTHASMLHSKSNSQQERTQSNYYKEKLPIMGKPSVLRTLKDHLYQCPSKLSEEMVKCMAAVYCWLHSSASANLSQKQLPLLSRSSTNIVLPRRGINEGGDWCCKPMVEISSLTTDKHSCSQASYAIENYRLLVEQLERVNVTQMETNAKIAFWINTYNSLLMHAYLAYGIPHSSMKRLALFHKAAYNIGGHIVSANTIEQSIFCFHTPRIGRWFEIILSTAMRKRSGEERQLISKKFSLPNNLPLVCFTLCTGALSDPALKVYTASNVKEELEAAAREFLQANVVVKKSKKIFLPKVLERYAKEASISSDDLIDWVAKNVDKELCEAMAKCFDRKTSRKALHLIEWLPYSSRFRYIFSEDLMEKPWWA